MVKFWCTWKKNKDAAVVVSSAIFSFLYQSCRPRPRRRYMFRDVAGHRGFAEALWRPRRSDLGWASCFGPDHAAQGQALREWHTPLSFTARARLSWRAPRRRLGWASYLVPCKTLDQRAPLVRSFVLPSRIHKINIFSPFKILSDYANPIDLLFFSLDKKGTAKDTFLWSLPSHTFT